MRQLKSYPLFLLVFYFYLNVSAALASGLDVIKAARHDTSSPLSQMAVHSSNGSFGQ